MCARLGPVEGKVLATTHLSSCTCHDWGGNKWRGWWRTKRLKVNDKTIHEIKWIHVLLVPRPCWTYLFISQGNSIIIFNEVSAQLISFDPSVQLRVESVLSFFFSFLFSSWPVKYPHNHSSACVRLSARAQLQHCSTAHTATCVKNLFLFFSPFHF